MLILALSALKQFLPCFIAIDTCFALLSKPLTLALPCIIAIETCFALHHSH